MLTIGPEICHVDRCARPGCSREAGCQGHAQRERAPAHYFARAEQLVGEAAQYGVVITIEQRPLQPFAMGRYETVASVRPMRSY
jgi:hypothetical protein